MITYPVDVANTRWTAVRISDNAIVKHNQKWPRADGGAIVDLNPDIALLLEVEGTQPAYDPLTHRLIRSAPVIDIPGNTHTHGWTTEALSQQEIDDAAEREQAKALYGALKAHSGTADERATRLENAVAYMLKGQYGAS